MTEQILAEREIEYFIKDWKLIPSVGGKFEVKVNDELVFSKKGLGRHAEEGEVRTAIMEVLNTLRPVDFKMPVKE